MDGVLLSDMGIDGTDVPPPQNVAAVAGAIATPGMSWEADREVEADLAELHSAPERPTAVILCCGGGGSILAAQELVNVKAATDHDWRALECVRTNGIGGTIRLMRTRPGDEECTTLLQEVNPSVVIGNVGPGESGADIVQAFVRSKARTLLLECTPQLPSSELWRSSVQPMLDESYQTEKAELKAGSVGVPSGKKRAFVAATATVGTPRAKEKLEAWRRGVERVDGPTTSLGGILGRNGTYFLKRGTGERAVFSFEDHMLSTTRAHVMGEKPPVGTYQPHATDSGGIEDAEELTFEDFAKVVSGQEGYTIPPTVSRGAAATVITNFTIPPMVREALGGLAIQDLLTTRGSEETKADDDVVEGLAALHLEDLGTVTRAVTRAVTRGLAEAADHIRPRSKPTPSPPTETEIVAGGHKEVTELPRTPQTPAPPDPQAAAPKTQPVPKRRTPLVTETARLLKDHARLVGRQRRDATLAPMFKESGSVEDKYLTDDNGVLWYAPRGQKPTLAIPRTLIPGVLSLVHSTFGHPGVARTTLLVRQKYSWPTLRKDVRQYVLSCGCRRRKRTNSRKVWMMPARFLRPWEVLEMDIQDFHQVSSNGNRYLLVVVDRASKFLFGYPLASKGALEVSRKLMEMLTFGVPQSIRSDGGGEFTAQVVGHLCRWLNVTLTHGPADFARSQGTAERMGGWFQEVLSILCQKWPLRWDQYVLPACWVQRVTPDPALPANMTPFRVLFGRDARTQIDAMTLSIDGAEFRGGLDSVVADRHQAFVEVRNVLVKR